MGLDVETPEPPSLSTNVDASQYEDADVQGNDYRRDELEEFLASGAWDDAFEEWAAHTDVDEAEFEIARELDLTGTAAEPLRAAGRLRCISSEPLCDPGASTQ